MNRIVLTPGGVTLAQWREVFQGAAPSLDPGCRSGVESAAATVATIASTGEPVYGINTGFGKLAGVRIKAAELSRLQRNIVLSHAAGVG